MSSHISPDRPAQIVALSETIKPAHYCLESDICIVGRADVCQIVVPDKAVSRIHAVIERDKTGNYIIHDADSANGTYINGQRLRDPYVLENCDEIGLGISQGLLRFKGSARLKPSC